MDYEIEFAGTWYRYIYYYVMDGRFVVRVYRKIQYAEYEEIASFSGELIQQLKPPIYDENQ